MSENTATQLDPIRQPTATDLAMVLLLGIMWGSAFPAIKIIVGTVDPVHVVMLRTGIGALILIAWMTIRRIGFPRDLRTWRQMAIMAFLNTLLPFFLIAWGEQHVDAGIAALLMGIGPLLALLISHTTTADDRLSVPKLAGVTLGFAGVMTIIGSSAIKGLGDDLIGQMAIFAANICYVASGAMIRHVRGIRLEAMAATNLVCGFAMTIPFIAFFGLPPLAQLQGETLVAVLWLGAALTGITYLMRFHIARSVGYSYMALTAYVIPVAGVVLSSLLLGEVLSTKIVIALVLIILGFAVARIRK